MTTCVSYYAQFHTLYCPLPFVSDSPLQADLWLLNSCTVKGPSEDGFRNSVARGRELGKALVLAGCVPQGDKSHPAIQGLSVVGVSCWFTGVYSHSVF